MQGLLVRRAFKCVGGCCVRGCGCCVGGWVGVVCVCVCVCVYACVFMNIYIHIYAAERPVNICRTHGRYLAHPRHI